MNFNTNLKDLHADKDTIINAVIILFTLFISINIFKAGSSNIKRLQEKMAAELNKNALLEQLNKVERAINLLKDSINKKDVSLEINTIGNIANKNSVNVISIRPATKEESPVYTSYRFNLKCEVDSYHFIGKFISELENHRDIFFIDSLIVRKATTKAGAAQQVQREYFEAELALTTIMIKG